MKSISVHQYSSKAFQWYQEHKYSRTFCFLPSDGAMGFQDAISCNSGLRKITLDQICRHHIWRSQQYTNAKIRILGKTKLEHWSWKMGQLYLIQLDGCIYSCCHCQSQLWRSHLQGTNCTHIQNGNNGFCCCQSFMIFWTQCPDCVRLTSENCHFQHCQQPKFFL